MVIGGTIYALTSTLTVIGIEGSGDRGTAVFRLRYSDDSRWWAISFYELRDGRISRSQGGTVLDLRNLEGLEIDTEHQTVWAETGLTAGEGLHGRRSRSRPQMGDFASVGIVT